MASDTNCHNMVSNLPLLFAGGYPTSLEKITESQLEKFIPFMVQCSLGNIQIHNNTEYSEPEWWPENVPFSIPLEKPLYESEWHEKLKTIVVICYKFHSSIFLLRFCQQLATYQPESLRFINNYNNTTSLFERSSNKLLVTFRNENMLYDTTPIKKITLLSSRKINSKVIEETVDTVETVFEIYLCDNCEAELYSKDAYDEHEKTCQEDDDVIFCGEEFTTTFDQQQKAQSTFLHNFSLVNANFPMPNQSKTPIKKNNSEQSSSSGKYGRQPRRSQIVLSSNIPFSSPAGQQLMKLSKSSLAHNYIQDKLERSERYCDTSSNWLKPIKCNRIPVTFRRPQDQTYRWYRFPRRQNFRSWYRQAFLNLNINELKLCRPMTVKLKKLTTNDIEAFHLENSYKNKSTLDQLNNIVDVIDLCSDDDDDFSLSAPPHQDVGNVSQTATTPASKKSPAFTEPFLSSSSDARPFLSSVETTFEMDTETSSQATMPMFNPDENYQYQNHEHHQSFLNGAQGSIVAQMDKLTELKDISMQANQSHISIDLTL